MALENDIQHLTAALLELAAAVRGNAQAAPERVARPDPATPTIKPAAEVKRTASPPVEEPAPVVEPPAAAPTLVYEDLMRALSDMGKALATAGKQPKEVRDLGVACLARVGAQKLPDLKDKPESWPLLLETIKRVAEGGEP